MCDARDKTRGTRGRRVKQKNIARRAGSSDEMMSKALSLVTLPTRSPQRYDGLKDDEKASRTTQRKRA